jgi:C-terminal processing protease CtpA/Prc
VRAVKGMSLREIVGAVRGPPGSVVELAIIPADADPASEHEYVAIPRVQISIPALGRGRWGD